MFMLQARLNLDFPFQVVVEVDFRDLFLRDYFESDLCVGCLVSGSVYGPELTSPNLFMDLEAILVE